MPFALIVIGVVLIVAGIRNTQGQLGTLLAGDFTGSPNYTYWAAAIIGVGLLGYSKSFKGLSGAFVALIIVALLFSNKGFFAKLQSALASGTSQPASATNNAIGVSSSSGGSGGILSGLTGSGSPLSDLGGSSGGSGGDSSGIEQYAQYAEIAAMFA